MAKRQFKAESKRLLDLMINSIYTHKEIFLRELISNASDAMDKLLYLALTDPAVGMSRGDFEISIEVDKANRTLKVSDNGIGMGKEELEQNLGVIARSGSLQFKDEMEANPDIDIIGQFGVGFYSTFMVSEKVTVISRRYGEETAWKWESEGADGYTITVCDKEGVGTDVIIHSKEDTEDEKYSRFLDTRELSALVKKYSDYIRYPIKAEMENYRPKEKSSEDEKTEYETVLERETINSMVPIWQRNRSELTDEDYNAFYKEKFFDFEDPIKTIHVSAEGSVTFKALLFIPKKTPYDFYSKEYARGLQLYSSGVLIMDKCEDLLPDHFRFVRGIVDSQDLSLNISREMLQHTRQLKIIASNIEKRIKSDLARMLESEREKYEEFFKSFGLQLKYSLVNNYGAEKEQLRDLLLFYSSAEEKLTTLAEYVSRMKEEQKYIYYACGDSLKKISQLPQTELLREKGYEMLFLTDEVDEFALQMLSDHEEKEFRSISGGDLGLESGEEKEKTDKLEEDSREILAFIKERLGESVKEVKISRKLVKAPVCISTEGSVSLEMERYFNSIQPDSKVKAERVLEINPSHPAYEALVHAFVEDKDKAGRYAELLYNQALIMANMPIEDPAGYAELVCGLMN